jgi:hypothetical protein
MLLPSNDQGFDSQDLDNQGLDHRIRHAHHVTAKLVSAVIGAACRRFPSAGQHERTARIERLIAAEAWSDAAFALIELELPQWQVRRIAYDQGEWHCALSRQRELPEWLDQSIESHHPDLPLAILSAFVEAQRASAPSIRPSVPIVRREASAVHEALCTDNFA